MVFALPELFTLFRKPLLLSAPVVLVKNLLLALPGIPCGFLSHQEVDLLELEFSLIESSHVSSFSCPCGAWWVHDVVDQPTSSHQSPKLLLHDHLVWQQSGCTQSDRVVNRKLLTCGVLKWTWLMYHATSCRSRMRWVLMAVLKTIFFMPIRAQDK